MCVCANACVRVRVQVLIIDQGSIIDRIDYNMEKTAEQTQQVNTRARTEREREREREMQHLTI